MWKYVLKRLIILLPVLFGATFIVYLLFYFAPGNADRSAVRKAATPEEAEIIREERGLNDPILVQYARTMKEILSQMKEITVVEPVVTLRGAFKETDVPALEALADALLA